MVLYEKLKIYFTHIISIYASHKQCICNRWANRSLLGDIYKRMERLGWRG